VTTNEILKKIQTIETLTSTQIYEIFQLSDYNITENRIEGYLRNRGDKEYLDCGAQALGNFLDGLIKYKRGYKNNNRSDKEPLILNNNLIMKKLRIAYDLKESDLYEIFDIAGINITKSELSSIFRSETHKRFRLCPDSVFKLFLDALDEFLKK